MADDFEHCFQRALHQPPSYREVTELAGQGGNASDFRAGYAAWLLNNIIDDLQIFGVHSKVLHFQDKTYFIPLFSQIELALGLESKISDGDLQLFGHGKNISNLDVLGVKNHSVWLVQTVWGNELVDSAVDPDKKPSQRTFLGSPIFRETKLKGKKLETLYITYDLIRRAFPEIDIFPFALVMDRRLPDFELYGLEIPSRRRRRREVIILREYMRTNSIDYIDRLKENHDSLLMLRERVDNELFKGIPPCRGGRTLGMLAAAASRQLKSNELIVWNQPKFSEVLKDEFGYEVTRDKVRHDIDDRLLRQGFMEKWDGEYYLTMKGLIRYQYCLAKYTTKGPDDPHQIVELCRNQKQRIRNHFSFC